LSRLASRGSAARVQLTRTLHATTANSVFAAKRKRAKHGPGHPQSNEDPSTQGNGGFDAGPCTLSAATTATRRKARVRGRRHQVARLTHERASQKTLCDLCRFEETRRRRVKSVMSRPAILQSADRRPVSCARPMSSFLPCSCCPGLPSLRARRRQQVGFVPIDDDARQARYARRSMSDVSLTKTKKPSLVVRGRAVLFGFLVVPVSLLLRVTASFGGRRRAAA
jgi:hypothetical protein